MQIKRKSLNRTRGISQFYLYVNFIMLSFRREGRLTFSQWSLTLVLSVSCGCERVRKVLQCDWASDILAVTDAFQEDYFRTQEVLSMRITSRKNHTNFCALIKSYLFSVSVSVLSAFVARVNERTSTELTSDCSLRNLRQRETSQHTVNANK